MSNKWIPIAQKPGWWVPSDPSAQDSRVQAVPTVLTYAGMTANFSSLNRGYVTTPHAYTALWRQEDQFAFQNRSHTWKQD